ncbi:PCI domain-containing protein 2-like [Oppia nitens]|uniref:PCI domain-containing protein 2-like n=1 Tax=Oppia nitens TaxID=1686743 RepID=UPI0023DC4337|nr:PCI domain-containing protein 2-like [Oppia nitens]
MAGPRANLNSFLTHFNDIQFQKDGQRMATALSIRQRDALRPLLDDINETLISRYIFSPFDDLLIAHLKCCKALVIDNDPIEAFNNKCQLIQALIKVLIQLKDENWILPVMYISAVEVRQLATLADNYKQTSGESSTHVKPDECLEEAASQIMSCFRVCANDNRATQEVTKRKGMINLINQLFKIYFKINKLHLYKPLTRALENANMMNQFSLAQTVTYNYFTGMKSLFDSDYKKAEELLSFAFNNCHPEAHKNLKLILIYLIPVKMLLGHMPSDQLLYKYDLQEFALVIRAVKDGNVRDLDEALETNAHFFWSNGIYLILEKLKMIAFRNICKKVSLMVTSHQIPIQVITTAMKYLYDEEINLEEVHCILANLIFEGKIKGYISLQHQKLVISKQNPFPALSSITS